MAGYRGSIDGKLQGLTPAARAAFMVGSRYAMYMGAVLLVGAVFVFVRGQHQVMPAEADALDGELTAIDDEQPVEVRPALSHAARNTTPAQEISRMTFIAYAVVAILLSLALVASCGAKLTKQPRVVEGISVGARRSAVLVPRACGGRDRRGHRADHRTMGSGVGDCSRNRRRPLLHRSGGDSRARA